MIKHFKTSEFDSPDEVGSGNKMNKDFLMLLDKARELAEVPFKITSGYRTKEWNLKVGGRVGSSHCKGLAADIHLPKSSRERFLIINSILSVGINRIGISFKNGFLHCDVDNLKDGQVLWSY